MSMRANPTGWRVQARMSDDQSSHTKSSCRSRIATRTRWTCSAFRSSVAMTPMTDIWSYGCRWDRTGEELGEVQCHSQDRLTDNVTRFAGKMTSKKLQRLMRVEITAWCQNAEVV